MILDQRTAKANGARPEDLANDQAAIALGQARLAAIHYYPIKSCAGHALATATVEKRGLRYDREFMVVDAAHGVMLTQREQPRMALVTPHRDEEHLTVEGPGMKTLTLDISHMGPTMAVTIWKDEVASIDQGDAVAEWFSRYLGFACRLVRMASVTARPVNRDYAVDDRDVVSYADGFPFLAASVESLADLNARLPDPVPMNRFRPNLVLAGSGIPFGEDYLRRFSLGAITFQAVKPCARCVITTVEQETATTGKEPLRTLATFRRGTNGALFGQNLIHDRPGTLNVGDQVQVLELWSDSPVLN